MSTPARPLKIKHSLAKSSKKDKQPVTEGASAEKVPVLRSLFPEKGFKRSESSNWGLPASFKSHILQMSWEEVVRHRPGYVPSIVREFYDRIDSDELSFVYVRGGKVKFGADHINRILKLEEGIADEYYPTLKGATEEVLTQMKDDLTLPGTPWKEDDGSFRFIRNQLKHEAKVWYHFLRHSLLPTSHMENVDKERLVLLHCIMRKKKINVGRIIKEQISSCALKGSGYLFFPCLITELCEQQGVEWAVEEGPEENKGQIDMMSISRMKPTEEPPATKGKQQAEEPEEENLNSSLLQQILSMLQQQEESNQAVWEFMFMQHAWTLRNFKKNNKSYSVPVPAFPRHILKSLQEKHPEEATTSHQPSQPSQPSTTKKSKKQPVQEQHEPKEKEAEEKDTDSSASTEDWLGTPPSKKTQDSHSSAKVSKHVPAPETSEAEAKKASTTSVAATPSATKKKSKASAHSVPELKLTSSSPPLPSDTKKRKAIEELKEGSEVMESLRLFKKKTIAKIVADVAADDEDITEAQQEEVDMVADVAEIADEEQVLEHEAEKEDAEEEKGSEEEGRPPKLKARKSVLPIPAKSTEEEEAHEEKEEGAEEENEEDLLPTPQIQSSKKKGTTVRKSNRPRKAL